MSVLFITLKSNVHRLISETWEKKCFLVGFELLSSDKFPFSCPPAFIYTWQCRHGYFNVYIKARPNVGVLFGDVWHRNKSLRRARKEHVLLPGSFGLLRAARLNRTQLLNKQAGGWRSNPMGKRTMSCFPVGLTGDLKYP